MYLLASKMYFQYDQPCMNACYETYKDTSKTPDDTTAWHDCQKPCIHDEAPATEAPAPGDEKKSLVSCVLFHCRCLCPAMIINALM